jgi:hypothetical protein
LTLSVFSGVAALSDRHDYDHSCDSASGCQDNLYDSARTAANATDGLVAFGAALVVTSIVLFSTRPKPVARSSRVAWGIVF